MRRIKSTDPTVVSGRTKMAVCRRFEFDRARDPADYDHDTLPGRVVQHGDVLTLYAEKRNKVLARYRIVSAITEDGRIDQQAFDSLEEL